MISFLITSFLFGIADAMDAFSVSIVNGLKEPEMKRRRMGKIAGCYAAFQFFMPVLGWLIVRTIARIFEFVEVMIPWIGFFLLLVLGINMIREGRAERKYIKENGRIEGSEDASKPLNNMTLFLQGLATSIDALSVGFVVSGYTVWMALVNALIIATVTFVICIFGLKLGKKLGILLSGRATILGGVILVAIGISLLL